MKAHALTSVLLFIDSGFCHSMPCNAVDFADAYTVKQAIDRGLVRRVEAVEGHAVRNVPRFVLTSGGSHHVGTFRGGEMHKDYDGNWI